MPVSAQKSRLLIGDFSLSAFLKNVQAVSTLDMLDATVMTDTAKTFSTGLDTSTMTSDGLLDNDASSNAHMDQLNDWKAATASEPVTYGPFGISVGSELWMAGMLESQFTMGAQVAALDTFGFAAQTDGPLDFGKSLHDLGAETIDASATSVDNGAASSNGGVGHVHVTAFSGFSAASLIVEHSTNNSVWTTLMTFTSVAGLTSERKTVTGTVNRYLRATWDVTGTGSITFQMGFARR